MDTKKLADAVRILSMDGVQKANSGHPGAPMGMADIAEVLWRRNLKHNPANPQWTDRDRFVLSNGHASMLLYSLLHLTGYDLPLEELKNFRQLNSKTAGHPENHLIPGIETTTGPLGQGIANAAGMALAEKVLAEHFNEEGFPIVDHFTYAFTGDGCLMEGISHEVCSLAGTLNLGKLIVFYDDNGISIDGNIEGWFTDDTAQRFTSYGWQVVGPVDGHDADALQKALKEAKSDLQRPSIVICKTKIGFGSPNKEGSASTHGAPLGEEEIALTRKALGWEHEEPFFVPQDIYDAWNALEDGARAEASWNAMFKEYRKAYPQKAEEFERRTSGSLPLTLEAAVNSYKKTLQQEGKSVATRKASQDVLEVIGLELPELIGGSADLAPSNLTKWKGSKPITGSDAQGNYIHFGVREFGMTAMMNGMRLHGGFIPYSGTFLIFMEYARNAVRMAALMGLQQILVYTHDSIGVGEDGPTHQPVEQAASLRTTPNMSTWRPADSVETAAAWKQALMKHDGPTALLLTRQGLPVLTRNEEQVSLIDKGGYILWDSGNKEPDLIILSSGSEVQLALKAAEELAQEEVKVRVVSMPSPDTFDAQDQDYRDSVLPPACRKRIAVEAASADFWHKYTGLDGAVIGMNSFGESAPADKLFPLFGFTVENIVKKAKEL